MFLSPAVTPWKSTLTGVGYNNPSLRLYKYDRTTSQFLDYYQYYLNLTEANSKQGERIFYARSKNFYWLLRKSTGCTLHELCEFLVFVYEIFGEKYDDSLPTSIVEYLSSAILHCIIHQT